MSLCRQGALIAALALMLPLSVRAAETFPYHGSWSNGRGETLVITEKTLQFGSDRPVKYREVTRGAGDQTFELEIISPGKINAFPGKTVSVQFENGSMIMTTYASHGDFVLGATMLSRVTWEKDVAPERAK